MKICYFYTDITLKGGIERVMSLLLSSQSKDTDLHITVVSQYKTFEIPYYSFPQGLNYVFLSKDPYSGRPGSFHRLKLMFLNIFRIVRFFHKNEFDIILSQAFPNVFMLFISGVDMGKVVAVEHVFYGYYNKFVRTLRNMIYKKSAAVVVLTNNDKEYFSRYFSQVYVIPNPVVLSSRRHSLLEDGRIISVGRLEHQKGYDILLRIFAKIHAVYPTWTLDIYGEGNYENFLRQEIEHLGLSDIVSLCGTTERVLDEMFHSSFYVMSSRFEGFGMVLVEAMSQGLPCVSFNCPNGPSDIIIDGKNGILVENQNEEALYAAMIKMIENRELRISMGKNAYDSVYRYDINTVIGYWKNLYSLLIK